MVWSGGSAGSFGGTGNHTNMTGGANVGWTGAGGWGRQGGEGDPFSQTQLGEDRNTLFAVGPNGALTQIGMPSLNGGMMRTASGWGNTGYDQGHYSNTQRNIKANYADRVASEKAMRQAIAEKEKSWAGGQVAKSLLAEGDLAGLDVRGYDTAGMRETHHGGGLLGNMFDWGKGADDVQTLSETERSLASAGHLTKDPKTGGYSKAGLGPMNGIGYGLSMIAPGVGKKAAEVTYGYTKNPQVAQTLGKAAWAGASGMGASMQPSSMPGMLSTGLTMAGFPGVTQFGQMAKSMQTAADLNYAGYTASPNKPKPASRNDNPYLSREGFLG